MKENKNFYLQNWANFDNTERLLAILRQLVSQTLKLRNQYQSGSSNSIWKGLRKCSSTFGTKYFVILH